MHNKWHPMRIDAGMDHLGGRVPGLGVPYKTRNGKYIHKDYGVTRSEDGKVAAFPLAAVVAGSKKGRAVLNVGAFVGDVVVFEDEFYRIEPAPNNNIKLVPVE